MKHKSKKKKTKVLEIVCPNNACQRKWTAIFTGPVKRFVRCTCGTKVGTAKNWRAPRSKDCRGCGRGLDLRWASCMFCDYPTR